MEVNLELENEKLKKKLENNEQLIQAILTNHRINNVFHIPNLFIANYKKQFAEEKGVFVPDEKYPVLFITIEEIEPQRNATQILRGYDCSAFVLDKRNKMIPISLYDCDIQFGTTQTI